MISKITQLMKVHQWKMHTLTDSSIFRFTNFSSFILYQTSGSLRQSLVPCTFHQSALFSTLLCVVMPNIYWMDFSFISNIQSIHLACSIISKLYWVSLTFRADHKKYICDSLVITSARIIWNYFRYLAFIFIFLQAAITVLAYWINNFSTFHW